MIYIITFLYSINPIVEKMIIPINRIRNDFLYFIFSIMFLMKNDENMQNMGKIASKYFTLLKTS